MASRMRKSRLFGPFLVSCVLCIVIIDYTIYVQTHSSLFSGFWGFLSYIFSKLIISISVSFSNTNLLLLGAVLLLGILGTALSLRGAAKAMRVDVADGFVPPINPPPAKVAREKAKPLGEILISYNRDETDGFVHLLYERLNKRFPSRVALGTTTNQFGIRSVDAAVGACDILLAIVGSKGFSTAAANSQSSGDSADLMCVEIASALRLGVPVIPVLLQDAHMPVAEELPDDVSDLAQTEGIRLNDDDMVGGIEGLIKSLEKELGEDQPSGIEQVIRLVPIWSLGAAFALALLIIMLREWGVLRF